MRVVALALILALAGCASTSVQVSSGNTGADSLPGRAAVVAGGTGLYVSGHVRGNSLAAVVLAGLLLGAAYDDYKSDRPFPSLSVFTDWLRPPPPPTLDPGRHITEQDCTKPVDLTRGNLRCK